MLVYCGSGYGLFELDKGSTVSVSDSVSFIPLSLEVNGPFVPFFDGGGDSVHGMNSPHDGGRNSPQEEIDEVIIIVDFTEGSVVFELGYISPKVQVL